MNVYPFQQLEAKPTFRLAIKAMCAQCAGGPTCKDDVDKKFYDSDWKTTIKNCPCTSCPLHQYRPYQAKEKKEVAA